MNWLLQSLDNQTSLPSQIFLVYDKKIDNKSYTDLLSNISQFKNIANITKIISNVSDFNFIPSSGASYVRNYWLKQTRTQLTMFIDDDNEFTSSFVSNMLSSYKKLFSDSSPWVLMPIEELRYTWSVRFAWYSSFNPLIVRPIKSIIQSSPYQINFGPSNCFMWSTQLFKENLFDENLPFVYEDFLFFRQISNKSNHIYLDPTIRIHHIMRTKTKLEDLYVWTINHAYQKWKNRSVLINKTCSATEKIQYYLCWLWWQTIYLVVYILLLASPKQKIPLIIALFRWTIKGIIS